MKIKREGEVKKVYIFYFGTNSIHRYALSWFIISKRIVVKRQTLLVRVSGR